MAQSQSCPSLRQVQWDLSQRREVTQSEGQCGHRIIGTAAEPEGQCGHRIIGTAAEPEGQCGHRIIGTAAEPEGQCGHRIIGTAAEPEGQCGHRIIGTAAEPEGQGPCSQGHRKSGTDGEGQRQCGQRCRSVETDWEGQGQGQCGQGCTPGRPPQRQWRRLGPAVRLLACVALLLCATGAASGSTDAAMGLKEVSLVTGTNDIAAGARGRGSGAARGGLWGGEWVVRQWRALGVWGKGGVESLSERASEGAALGSAQGGYSEGGGPQRAAASAACQGHPGDYPSVECEEAGLRQSSSDGVPGHYDYDRLPKRLLKSTGSGTAPKRKRRVVGMKKVMKLKARPKKVPVPASHPNTKSTTPSKKKKRGPPKQKKKQQKKRGGASRRRAPRKRTTFHKSPSPRKATPKKEAVTTSSPPPFLRIPQSLNPGRARSSYPLCPTPTAPRPPPSSRSPPPPLPPAAPGTPYLFPTYELYPICLDDGPMDVTLSAKRFSKFSWKGWGTTLARFGTYIGGLPQDQMNEILDLLFDPDKGLGLNIVRYTVWGGRNPENSPQFEPILNVSTAPDTSLLCYNPNMWFTGEGFQTEAGGAYDWSRDATQRAALLGAKARGADTFTAVSYSPPWFMTVSGDVAGSASPKATNLRADSRGAFAEYLSEVVRQYQRRWGVIFKYLEPVNEPNEYGGWVRGGRQEGCSFSPQDMDALYPLIASALARKNLSTGLVGFDSWAATTADNLESRVGPGTQALLSQIHTHGYVVLNPNQPNRATEDPYMRIRDRARALGRAVWQTEWTFLQVAGADMDLGTALGRNIIESVNFMGASAYLFWQAVDYGARFSLLGIRWDPDQLNSYPHVRTKKFWVFKQFTDRVPKGSVALPISSSTRCTHSMTSFYDPAAQTLSLFVVNQQVSDQEVSLRLQGFRPADASRASSMEVDAYRTSTDENYVYLGYLAWGQFGSPLTVTAIGRSVTTFVFLNVAPLRMPAATLKRKAAVKK